MSSITTLKDKLATPTLHFALLSVATGGIYPLLWLWKHQDTVMQETGREFSSPLLVIWMAVCFGLAAVLRPYTTPQIDPLNYTLHTPMAVIAITFILTMALMVLYIVWAFKARTALQHYALTQFHFELKMNVFYTLAFSVYYINYCINALPESLAKHQLLRGQTQPVMQAAPAASTTTADTQPPASAE
ncbi:TPA: DUF4234 domain-containing protein [Klebsiella pneumoniae]|uniref:DUF4234 domain-containing protein n=1 Tax=Klebsiella pneumoniae TaxID=573 RepID=UPI000C7BDB95|nr:DUF4234 domain-containing protein [Klebsiella pneumoniae]EIX9106404.1 DUF4234 domain-containing protein [Klebsiella pneumoniae]EIY1879755.1 DUF4234 domain-containing protein [Klebsiella pneumoniae]EKJ7635801.1 DUF4234 domain-containing protein [Klebsiella pneumoniae]MCQ0531709.1 DUF4234 domain-containing protein [Klebsiella pneumoniae]MCQ0574321.1 DUF4234 domain-containing protein [Klebsiella pneumoniae]